MTHEQINQAYEKLEKIQRELFTLGDWYLDCEMIEDFCRINELRKKVSAEIDALFDKELEK